MESFLSDNSSASLNARKVKSRPTRLRSGASSGMLERWSKHNSSTYPNVPYWFDESTGESIWTDPTVAITVIDSSSGYRTIIEEKLKSNRIIRRSDMERINSSICDPNLSKTEKDNIFKDCIMEAIKNENCFIKNISSIVQLMHMDIVLEAIISVLLLEDFPLNSTLADRYVEVMLDSLEGYEASSLTSATRISRMLSNAIGALCLKHLTIISTVDEVSNEAKTKDYSDDEFLSRICMQSCDRDAKSIDRVYDIISKIFRRCYRVSGRKIHATMKHRIHVLSFHPNLAFEFRMKLLKFNLIVGDDVHDNRFKEASSKRNLKAASAVTNVFKAIMPSSKYSIVLLLGAPGIGKSHLGNRLVANQCADRYVDIGKMLRDYKVLEWYHRYQTESRRDEMCRIAKYLLSEAITEYLTTTDGSLPLVLTYVKEPSNAYQFIEMVEQLSSTYNITSTYHAWLLYDEIYLQKFRLQKYTNRFSVGVNSIAQKRFRKWLRHYSSIIEVLSGTNRLYKVTSFSNNLKAPVITPFKLLVDSPIQHHHQHHDHHHQHLVTQEQIRCHVGQSIKSLLGISDIHFRSTGNKLTSEQHLQWITSSINIIGQRRKEDDYGGHQRYFISKSDEGRRFWLYIDAMHNMWLISLKGNLYSTEDLATVENLDSILQTLVISTDDRSHNTPFETVLDGVMMTMSDNRQVFRAFDILAYNRKRTWIWKLSDRLKALRTCCELYNIHSIHCHASGINIEINPSYPVDNDCVALLEQTSSNSDAWVFTPELPYVFGPDPLMFEWRDPITQIATLIHVPNNEVSYSDRQSWRQTVRKEKQQVVSVKRKADQTAYKDMEYGMVYKCRWWEAGLCWIPVRCELDAAGLTHEDTTATSASSRDEGAGSGGGGVAYQDTSTALEEVKMVKCLSRDILLQSLKNESKMDTAAAAVEVVVVAAPVVPVPLAVVHHPVKRLDFDALFFQIASLVQSGVVEEFNDEQTGLRVYNTYTHKSDDCDGSVVDESIMQVLDICRGLVLHPPSKTIVASPFVRFRRIDKHDIDIRTNHLTKLSCKYDGTLIIAFLWNNQVFTSTKRRMNSEQASLALDIIQASHSIKEQLIEGWTYLFELIGDGNLHVCNYNVPLSLVLLTIINSDGVELSSGDKYVIAKNMDVLSSVAMYAHLNSAMLGGLNSIANTHLSLEGFVMEDDDDIIDHKRFKIINSKWNQSSIVTKSVLHPTVVWDAIRRHHWEVIMKDRFIPKHVMHELYRMLECMVVNFESLILQKALNVVALMNNIDETKTATVAAAATVAATAAALEDSEVTRLLDVNQISAANVERLLVEAYNRNDTILMLSTTTAAQSSGVDLISTIIPAVIDQCFSFEQSTMPSLLRDLTGIGAGARDSEWDSSGSSSSSSVKESSVLRLLLLNYVQPSTNGVLVGYTPCSWLSQTFAKGWGTSTSIHEAGKRLSWDKVQCSSTKAAMLLTSIPMQPFTRLIFDYLYDDLSIAVTEKKDKNKNVKARKGRRGVEMSQCHEFMNLRRVCRSWNYYLTFMYRETVSAMKRNYTTLQQHAHVWEEDIWDTGLSYSPQRSYRGGSDHGMDSFWMRDNDYSPHYHNW